MTRHVRILLALAVALAACRSAKPDDTSEATPAKSRLAPGAGGEATITLDTAEVRRLDLRTEAVTAATWSDERELPGEVVAEPERTSVVRAPIAGRFVVEAGQAWPAFGASVAAGTIIGRVGDALPLALARGGTVSRVGAQPGELVEAGQVLLEVTDYSRPVARVVWLGEEGGAPPARVTLHPGEGAGGVAGTLVGAAPQADETSRRAAFLYRAAHGWPGARPGVPIRATYGAGAPRQGVRVPAAAVVQWDGLTWAFVEVAPGQFVRRPLAGARALDGGWFADGDWTRGARVVVRGAQALLSEEFRSRITVGDETGD